MLDLSELLKPLLLIAGISMSDIHALIDGVIPEMTRLRHDLHAHPELAFEERRTAEQIVEQLEAIEGLTIRTGLAKTGVVAVLNAEKPGRCVALRADIDALAIQEETNLPYKSQHTGIMHACGHDGHIACLIGAAQVLSRCADDLPGKVKFIFQPAEEGGAGGKVLVHEGVLDDPKVDAIFALHGWPYIDLGTIEVAAGPTMGSVDVWSMTIHGSGGHAAYPHKSIDPIVIGSQIVQVLQTIVSRSTDPIDPVVLTIGRFHAGSAANIIPNTARLDGTVRTLNTEVRKETLRQMEQLATRTAEAFGATVEIEYSTDYPVTINHVDAAELVGQVACGVVGDANVDSSCEPCLCGEDFAFFAEQVPAAIWRLGVRQSSEADQPHLHQPTFDFPDAALPLGIRMHCEIARRFLADA